MGKFYKPGRIVVVTSGRYAGKKGIIVRSNYENTKTKKFPHCLVLGLSKYPKRVTKKSLKKLEDRVKRLETQENKEKGKAALEKLKRLGVFVKTYNMQHILATRYKVQDNYNIEKHIDSLDKLENNLKEATSKLATLGNKEEKQEEVKKTQTEIGELRTKIRDSLASFKVQVGEELYNRYVRGFIKTRDNAEENEKIAASEYLFTKLKF